MGFLVTLLVLAAIVLIACAVFVLAIRRHIRKNPHTDRDIYDKW